MSNKDSHPHTKEHSRWQISTVVLIGLFILFSSFALVPPPPTLGGNMQEKGTRRIILDHADRLEYNAELSPGVQRLVGNVQLRHLNWLMTCDSAFLDQETDQFEAFGNVEIHEGDSITILSKYLNYDGIARFARLRNTVELRNSTATLYTDSLDYDRVAGKGYYFDTGTIVDSLNTLTSVYGEYTPGTDEAIFRDAVELVNPDFTLNTDYLVYNTRTKIAVYDGPTHIVSDSGHIESMRGVYDTQQDLGILLDRSTVYNTHGTVEGDSLLYDNRLKFAEAFGDMVLIDTVNQAILRGEYGYYDENKEYAFSTQHAWLTDYSKPDTLYIGADTLELITRKQEPKDIRITRAYHNTRVYRNDAQAVADSLHYFSMDSTMSLYGAPILWRDSLQLEGDTVRLYFADDTLHHATAWLNAKAMRLLEEDKFEQIKGDSLITFFADSTIREMQAHGEVEMVYYALQESIKHYYAVGRIKSPHLYAYLAADTLQKTIWQGPASGGIHPIESVSPDISRISGLVWQPEKRPKSPDDLFAQELDSLGAPIPYTHPHTSALRGFSGAQAALAAYQLLDKEVERIETQQASLEQKESQDEESDKEQEKQEETLSPYICRPDDNTPSWQAPQPLDIFNNAMKQLWDSFSSSTTNEQDASNTSQSIGIKSEKP